MEANHPHATFLGTDSQPLLKAALASQNFASTWHTTAFDTRTSLRVSTPCRALRRTSGENATSTPRAPRAACDREQTKDRPRSQRIRGSPGNLQVGGCPHTKTLSSSRTERSHPYRDLQPSITTLSTLPPPPIEVTNRGFIDLNVSLSRLHPPVKSFAGQVLPGAIGVNAFSTASGGDDCRTCSNAPEPGNLQLANKVPECDQAAQPKWDPNPRLVRCAYFG